MDDPLVRALDVCRVYGSGPWAVEAVVGATFSIRTGDHLAMVGPSGSGKSTLLHLIAALDRPSSGTIEWPGLGPRDGLRPGPVAVAFQGQSLLPPLTVLENVELPVLLAGGSGYDARAGAERLIAMFELEDVSRRLPEEISAGQAQRASVARALTGTPRLVLADEPTGQQDREGAHRVMRSIIAETGRTGAALVVATHDPAVAAMVSQRWAVDGGRLRTAVPV
jgi:ABC-type lipoprotein export system ATPase subunit